MALTREYNECNTTPRVILVFSGKRKSGKDYIAEILQKKLGMDKCAIMRLSEPLKSQYAKEHNLCLEKLLDSSSYKETYRLDMIKWGEEKRTKDEGFFIRIVANGSESNKPIWIISDARRKTDIRFLLANYGRLVTTFRVVAPHDIKICRGWKFNKEIDEAESECDLDSGIDFDYIISNDGNNQLLEDKLCSIVDEVQRKLNEQNHGSNKH